MTFASSFVFNIAYCINVLAFLGSQLQGKFASKLYIRNFCNRVWKVEGHVRFWVGIFKHCVKLFTVQWNSLDIQGKNPNTTVQCFGFCIPCACDIKSLSSLDIHIKGAKHIRYGDNS